MDLRIYVPADATATQLSLASVKPRMVYPSGTDLLKLSWEKGRQTSLVNLLLMLR